MAHPRRKGSRRLAAFGAAFVACLANDAWALALGDAQVRSSLGEPLALRIPVTLAAGESIEPGCFSIMREPGGEIPRVTGARISVERSAAGAQLRIESRGPINEPAFAVGVVANCPGLSGEIRRDYSLLLDPPTAGRASPPPAAASARAQPEAGSLRAIAATLVARIGDTLDSIANAIFPRNRAAKKSYLEALRDTNPTLATLGDNEPIPVDTPIALPDLRTFARNRPARTTTPAHEEAPKAARAPRASSTPRASPPPERAVAAPVPQPRREAPARRSATPPPGDLPAAVAAPSTSPSPAPTARRARAADSFVLRLSSPEVDLTRSRSIDDRARAQLRERQMILDADDQVSAVLALRHSVKQLETRVAELQLKLAGMPSSFPPARPAAEKVEPAKPPEKAPVAPPPAPPVVAAAPVAKVEPPPAAKVEPPPAAKIEPAPAPKVDTPATTIEQAPAKTPDRPVVRRAVTEREWLNYGLWVLAVLLLFAAAYLAWRLWQRRRSSEQYEGGTEEESALPEPEAVAAPADDSIVVADEAHIHEPEPAAPAAAEFSPDGRRIIDADVELPTRLSNDSDDLRRRYIEERFPEITKGAINLDDPESIVKGARLFYEDGAIARAVELLHFAIERKPAQIKCWLALFEIFRLERLTGEFAALAHRFHEQHSASSYWPKVQYFGREIDPGNALYQPPPIDKFQTIGPTQARRLAEDSTFDPIAENWLGAPMDFENEVLANDLRKAVMAEAGILEGDLLANPMPALRNVEMFTVA
ncbi:MAG TPA: hypothetical protein VM051_01935 [Usitatibacter sp.]|nr:hypothetical protein [Usitatibacter sp.]